MEEDPTGFNQTRILRDVTGDQEIPDVPVPWTQQSFYAPVTSWFEYSIRGPTRSTPWIINGNAAETTAIDAQSLMQVSVGTNAAITVSMGRNATITTGTTATYVPYTPPSAVQMQRTIAEQQRTWEERVERLRQAEETAQQLLLRFLSPHQRRMNERHHYFHVRTGRALRRLYRIRTDSTAHNVELVAPNGSIIERLCAGPLNVPRSDIHLAQKLFLEADEVWFREVANIDVFNNALSTRARAQIVEELEELVLADPQGAQSREIAREEAEVIMHVGAGDVGAA